MKKHVYFFLELKRILKTALHTIMGAIVLTVLVGTVAFCASRALYGQKLMDTIRIGIVLDTDEEVTSSSVLGMAMSFLENMESVKATCEFVYCDEDEAYEYLEHGEFAAVMRVPKRLLEDIIDGTNTPVQVIFANEDSLTAAMLQTLTDAGARTLGAAQSGIYAVYDLYIEQGMDEQLQDAYDHLNGQYLHLALARSRAFKYEEIMVTGNLTTEMYYWINGIILILFLSGISLAGVLRQEKEIVQAKLRMAGISKVLSICARFVALLILYFVLTAIFLLGICGGQNGVWMILVAAVFISGLISSWFLFVYSLVDSEHGGMLLNFILSIIMTVLGGGLIPSAYMPQLLKSLGQLLPAGYVMNFARCFVSGQNDDKMWMGILVYIILLLSLTVGTQYIKLHFVIEERIVKSKKLKAGGGAVNSRDLAWICISFKRVLKQKVLIAIILVFAVGAICFGVSEHEATRVRCGVYVEDEKDLFLSEVAEKLLELNGIVEFYMCETRAQLEMDVSVGKAECGYVLPENLKDLLEQGKNKNLMTTIVAPSTVSARLIDEIVFSCMFETYAPQILVKYLKGNVPGISDAIYSEVQNMHKHHMIDGSTFSFEYNRIQGNNYERQGFFSLVDESIYGIFVFIFGLWGGYIAVRDRNNKVYSSLNWKMAGRVSLYTVFAPTFIAGITVLVVAQIVGGISNMGVDIARMMGCVLCVCAYVTVISVLFNTPKRYCMILTFLGIGSVLTVFVEMGIADYVPVLRWVASLWPPTWFLN